ncbi:MAG: TetR/AcrR family transcriptional regulator [Chloroflexi bacterium]|nr:MAG: TetR/AcrR family transcriptional regulator [Chloroflexota bacterium]
MQENILTKGERTRAELIESAHFLFLEKGYHGTSMRDIARHAGIAVAGIYNHFKGKDEIFSAVLLNYHPYLAVLPAMNAAEGKTVQEFIQDAARRMVESLGYRPDFIKLMFIELVEFNGSHIANMFEVFFPQVMEFARQLNSKEGRLRPIPIPILVRAFIGLFFSYVMTELLFANQLPEEMKVHSLDHFVDIYLNGILEDGE